MINLLSAKNVLNGDNENSRSNLFNSPKLYFWCRYVDILDACTATKLPPTPNKS